MPDPTRAAESRDTIWVLPVEMAEAEAYPLSGTEELTQLLIGFLEGQGLPAKRAEPGSEDSPQLACRVTRLEYAKRRPYPSRRRYEAELSCVVTGWVSNTTPWARTVSRAYEEMVLVNTMTKLPSQHDAVLLNECVLPVWEGMAYSVRLFLDRPLVAPPSPSREPILAKTPGSPQETPARTWLK